MARICCHSNLTAGTGSSLLATLDEMYSLSLSMFYSSLAMHANKLMEKVLD